MKTIKELEADGLTPRHMIEETKDKGFANAIKYIQIQTLKDVLGLIDEWLLKHEIAHTKAGKELKARIIGK